MCPCVFFVCAVIYGVNLVHIHDFVFFLASTTLSACCVSIPLSCACLLTLFAPESASVFVQACVCV